MTYEQAIEILGAELAATVVAQARAAAPLTPDQIDLLLRILGPAVNDPAVQAAA